MDIDNTPNAIDIDLKIIPKISKTSIAYALSIKHVDDLTKHNIDIRIFIKISRFNILFT